jgi:hypothetical protein
MGVKMNTQYGFNGKATDLRPSYRWEFDIKIDNIEIGVGGVNWIDLSLALVNMLMNLWIP